MGSLVSSVLREERRGRHRARRMAREVSGVAQNPIAATTGFAGEVFEGATEGMSGGSKVLLLLVGTAAAGGLAYWYFTRPQTPASSAATNSGTSTTSTTTTTTTTDAATLSNPAAQHDVNQAVNLAKIGHGPGKEGDVWARKAVADGANATQLATLRSYGYAV